MEHCSKCGKALPKIAGMYIFACYGYGDNITCEKCNRIETQNLLADIEKKEKIRKETPNNGCVNCDSKNADHFDYDNRNWLCEKCFYVTKYGEEKWEKILEAKEKDANEKTYGSIKLYMKERQFEWIHRHNFDDVISYELIENGNIEKRGSVSGALIGGAIAGLPGAIIGYDSGKKQKNICTEYRILIRMKGQAPIEIGYIGGSSGVAYDTVQFAKYRKDALATIEGIEVILNTMQKEQQNLSDNIESIADEIRKLKSLFDEGVISETEFEKAKSKLLDK